MSLNEVKTNRGDLLKMKNKERQTEKTEKTELTEQKRQELLQEKYLEYQMIEEQIKKMQEQVLTFKKQIEELGGIMDALQNLAEVKQGKEILVPMSAGIFIKAVVQETKEVLVNVGDNVVVVKKLEDAIQLVKKQQEDILDYREKVAKNTELIIEHGQKLEQEVMKLAQEQ